MQDEKYHATNWMMIKVIEVLKIFTTVNDAVWSIKESTFHNSFDDWKLELHSMNLSVIHANVTNEKTEYVQNQLSFSCATVPSGNNLSHPCNGRWFYCKRGNLHSWNFRNEFSFVSWFLHTFWYFSFRRRSGVVIDVNVLNILYDQMANVTQASEMYSECF